MSPFSRVHRRGPGWRSTAGSLALAGLLPLSACVPAAAPTAGVAAVTGLPTPVPPAALATLPPPKPAPAAAAGTGPAVAIENFNFVSAALTVAPGSTVVWTNDDDVQHTVTASDNSFASPAIDTNGTYAFTFTAPGTYTYFCAIHPFMTGKVIVQ